LSAYGEVTIDAMKKLLSAIRRKGIEEGDHILIRPNEENSFINQNALPEKSFDNKGNNIYYKVFVADLAPSAVYPFALDNQWLPEIFYDRDDIYYKEFEKEHRHKDVNKGAIGGHLEIRLTPTSLGTAKSVVCHICSKKDKDCEANISEYNW
jgi:hypothetical protein